jgi:hypothetical protein
VKLAIPQSARSNALLPHTNACCAAAAALSIWTNVGAADSGVYPVPSLDGYVLERTRFLDKNKQPDGKKETLVEIYSAGDQYLLRYSTKGQEWAWGVIGNATAGPDNTEQNYAIRDSDGDGVYDKRYVGDEEYFLPPWVGQLRPA